MSFLMFMTQSCKLRLEASVFTLYKNILATQTSNIKQRAKSKQFIDLSSVTYSVCFLPSPPPTPIVPSVESYSYMTLYDFEAGVTAIVFKLYAY